MLRISPAQLSASERRQGAAQTGAYVVSRRERKKVEMLFAHLKRILNLDRLRLRGPCGAGGQLAVYLGREQREKLTRALMDAEQDLARREAENDWA